MEKKPNNIDFLSKCSVCEASLQPKNILLVEEKEKEAIYHVSCSECLSSVVVFISNSQNGVVSLGVATDLDGEEVRDKISERAISSDEVIDFYQLVSSKKISVVDLIKKEG